jgi:hypothetical protein
MLKPDSKTCANSLCIFHFEAVAIIFTVAQYKRYINQGLTQFKFVWRADLVHRFNKFNVAL